MIYIKNIAISITPMSRHRHPHKELIPSERKSIPKPKILNNHPKIPSTTNKTIPMTMMPIISIRCCILVK